MVLPPDIILMPMLTGWLQEDLGRGDRTTLGLGALTTQTRQAVWVAKASGVIAGLPIAQKVFTLLDQAVEFTPLVPEGQVCEAGTAIAKIHGSLATLLMGERVALNLAMHLSGIATLTQQFVHQIADLPTQLTDTRKTTPGLRALEKYATQLGGAVNHRFGLDDAVMIKDNHIAAAGDIQTAVRHIRQAMPYPLTIEVEAETLDMVQEALAAQVDIIMLDNMAVDDMRKAVTLIRQNRHPVKIEASGNVTLATVRAIAATGVDYISSSAPITQSAWLDLSMRFV